MRCLIYLNNILYSLSRANDRIITRGLDMLKKNLSLIIRFYKDAKVSGLLLFTVFILSQFSMLSLIGKYRTCMQYDRCYKSIPDVDRSVYYMYGENLTAGNDFTAKYHEVLSELSQNSCVEDISCRSYMGTVIDREEEVNVIAMDERLLGYGSDTGIDEDGHIQIFLSPDVFTDRSVTDEIDLQIRTDEQTVNIRAVISGRYKAAEYLPGFNIYSNKMDCYDMLTEYTNTIFVVKTPETEKLLMKNDMYDSRTGFIFFSDGSAVSERSEVLEEMNRSGFSISTYDDIIANTEYKTNKLLEDAIPLPLMTFVLTFLFSISMVVLMLDKNMQTYSVYYLCGLSKKKSYFLFLSSIGISELLAAVINAAITLYCLYFPERRPEYMQDIMFSWNNLYLLLVQAVFVLMIIFLEIVITYHKRSFIQIKNQELK